MEFSFWGTQYIVLMWTKIVETNIYKKKMQDKE